MEAKSYVLTSDMQWAMSVRPSKRKGAAEFVITRDGFSLMEATFVPPADLPFDEWVKVAIDELGSLKFHAKFHAHARELAPDAPPMDGCRRDCPWSCARPQLPAIAGAWSAFVPSLVRRQGISLFLRRADFAQAAR